jgi:plasmid stabilization system protein ParE
VDFDEFTSLQE